MLDIYIPLYYSNLQNFIPEEEEILYSAFYKIFFKESEIDPFKINKKWDTHVLFTKNGVYFGEYQRKTQPIVKHLSWHRVKKIKKNSLKISRPYYKLKIKREPNFESRKSYKIRKHDSYLKIQPIMDEGLKSAPTDFLKQFESSRIYAEKDKARLQNLLADKYNKKFDKVIELLRFERQLRGDYGAGRSAFYKDIRKNKMKNQVHWEVIHIIAATYGLVFLPMSILLGIFLEFNGLTFSILILSMILIFFVGFHRYWIRKKRFELRKGAKFFKQAKSKTEQNFIESFSELPKNFEGLQIMRLMNLGSKAYQEKDFEKCVKIFQQILKINDKMDMSWYMLLENMSYLAKWEEMITIGEEAIKKHPNFGPTYHWLADAYNEMGKKEKALEHYKKGLEILKDVLEKDPHDDNVLNSIGYNYLRMEKFEDAVKSYKAAIEIRPKSEHHLHSLGQTYMKMGIYDKAIKYLEKSLEYNPKHSYSWFDLGLIYEDLNQPIKAIECFEKAVEYYPQWVKCREKLINLKPDSIFLSKKSQEIKETTAEYNLYNTLHSKGTDHRIKKVETSLNRLIDMDEKQLRVYLPRLIFSYRRRIERLKNNKLVPPFMIEILKLQKEYKEQILVNLRENSDYIHKFRKIIENDIELYRIRSIKKENAIEEYLESLFTVLLEMPYDQLVFYFKKEILDKEERFKYEPMDDKETEMRSLALVYVKDTLKSLEENRANIQLFRKEVRQGLQELKDGFISVYNEKMAFLF